MYTVYWLHYHHETEISTQGYIGCTSNLDRRIGEHKSDYNCNRVDRPVVATLKQHGIANLTFDVVYEGSKADSYAKELELRPQPAMGWNIRAGGTKTVHSTESKAKISRANLGKPSLLKGVPKLRSSINKMVATRIARDNYKHKEETKAKIAESTKYGKSHAAVKILLSIGDSKYSYDCIKECCDKHALNYSTIRSRLRKRQSHLINGYAVRYN